MATLANETRKRSINSRLPSVVAAVALMFALYEVCSAATAQQKTFSSAEEAVKAAIAAARNNDDKELLAIFGKQEWPFPIPVVKKGQSWVFDTDKGKEEILNRRIGENELNTIQVMLAVVDAQREYAMKDRDKNELLEYAQKFVSDPGKKNG